MQFRYLDEEQRVDRLALDKDAWLAFYHIVPPYDRGLYRDKKMSEATRKHVHEEVFDVTPRDLFAALHMPSAIRAWWGAATAIVMPEPGGLWVAAWGEDEDDPEYVTVATMRTFDPPRRIVMEDYRYRSKTGGLPFEADFVVEFAVEASPRGAVLRVTQDGFPLAQEADAFYAACETGWVNSFAGIRSFFEGASRSRQ